MLGRASSLRSLLVGALVLSSLGAPGCKRSKDGEGDGGSAPGAAATASAGLTPGQRILGADLVAFDLPAARPTTGWTTLKLRYATWSVPPGYTTADKLERSVRYTNPKEPGVMLILGANYEEAGTMKTTTAGITALREHPARKAVREHRVGGVIGVLSWMSFSPAEETLAWEACRKLDAEGYCEKPQVTINVPKGSADKYKQLLADVLSTLKVN